MADGKRITFVAPGPVPEASGGYRVLYTYANGLAQRGHRVTVLHAPLDHRGPVVSGMRSLLRYVRWGVDWRRSPGPRLALDRVRVSWVPSFAEWFVPSGDAVVATAAPTAEYVARYPDRVGTKFYLVQDLEHWEAIGVDRVERTWSLPLRKIVVSRWLQEVAESMGQTAVYVPNGLDEEWAMDAEPETRAAQMVLMRVSDAPRKGAGDGLVALDMARTERPDLRATVFDVPRRPTTLPSWIEYVENPSRKTLRELYNDAAVLVAPSRQEGWGLVPFEGMACGCAVVATDTGGHREFAVDEETALVVPVGDPQAMADALLRLVGDDPMRVRLARAGHRYVQRFRWEESIDRLESELLAER